MTDWAYLTWFPELGAQLVHDHDLAVLGSGVQGVVGCVKFGQDDWRVFRFEQQQVRVRGELLTGCPAPMFKYGEMVRTLRPRSELVAPIRAIRFHFKEQQLFFLVGSSQQRSRYWAHELEYAAQQSVQPDRREDAAPG